MAKKLLLLIACSVAAAVGVSVAVNFVFEHTRRTVRTIAKPVGEIVVKSGAGRVDLLPASKRIEVSATEHYVLERPTVDVAVKNAVLTVDSDCGTPVLKCYADLRLKVPRGVKVTVEADSGDVDAREIDVRSAHVQSDSGDVLLTFVGRQALLWVHTDSGRVDVIAADARAVDVQSDTGDVTVDVFRRAPRRVRARTDSGSVQVLARKGAYAIKAQTDSGDVTIAGLTRNARAPRSIEANSNSGDIALRAR